MSPAWRSRLGEAAGWLAVVLVVLAASLQVVAANLGPGSGSFLDQLLGRAEVPVLVGEGVDLLGTLWTYDHVDRMLRGEVRGLRTDLFAPHGFDTTVAQGMGWLDAVLALPLVRAMGVPGFYNLHVAVVMALNSLALLALFRSQRAPLPVAGMLTILLATSPYVTHELQEGRITQAHWVFPILLLWAVQRLLDGRGRWWVSALVAGLSLAAGCLVYWFAAMGVGVVAAIVAVAHVALNPEDRRRVLLGGLVLSVVGIGATLAAAWPAIGPLLQDSVHRAAAPWFLPPVSSLPGLVEGTWKAGVPLVLTPLALAAALVPQQRRRLLPWLLAAALAYTWPHGDGVALGDHAVPSAFVALREAVPLFHRLTWPSRLAPATMLALAGAVALASGHLARATAELPRRRAATAAVCVVLLLVGAADWTWSTQEQGFRMRYKSDPLQARDLYRQVTEHLDGGIIDIPLVASNSEYAYQLVHHRPLLGGPGIDGPNTVSAEHRSYIQGNSYLLALEAAAAGKPVPTWDREDRQRLLADGFGIVVVHEWKEGIDSAGLDALLGEPVLHSMRRAVYPLGDSRPGRRNRRPGRGPRP